MTLLMVPSFLRVAYTMTPGAGNCPLQRDEPEKKSPLPTSTPGEEDKIFRSLSSGAKEARESARRPARLPGGSPPGIIDHAKSLRAQPLPSPAARCSGTGPPSTLPEPSLTLRPATRPPARGGPAGRPPRTERGPDQGTGSAARRRPTQVRTRPGEGRLRRPGGMGRSGRGAPERPAPPAAGMAGCRPAAPGSAPARGGRGTESQGWRWGKAAVSRAPAAPSVAGEPGESSGPQWPRAPCSPAAMQQLHLAAGPDPLPRLPWGSCPAGSRQRRQWGPDSRAAAARTHRSRAPPPASRPRSELHGPAARPPAPPPHRTARSGASDAASGRPGPRPRPLPGGRGSLDREAGTRDQLHQPAPTA
nr:basic salivary proline-rich protein 3-like [Loxodonta africana]